MKLLLVCATIFTLSAVAAPKSLKEIKKEIIDRSKERVNRLDPKEDFEGVKDELLFSSCVKIAKTFEGVSDCAQERLIRLDKQKIKIYEEEKRKAAEELFSDHKNRELQLAQRVKSSPKHILCLKSAENVLDLQKCREIDLEERRRRLEKGSL